MKVDYSAVRETHVASEDTEDAPFDIAGVVVPIIIPEEDIAGVLGSYDSTNQYSPSAADSRVIARLFLDALKRKNGE